MPILEPIIDWLRRDDHNPIHALDGWLLNAVEKLPPSTEEELVASCHMRMGPRRRGPELTTAQMRRWTADAKEDRKLIRAGPVDPSGRSPWLLTDRGKQQLRSLRGVRPRLGGLLAGVTRRPSVWAYAVERLLDQEKVITGKPPPKRKGLPKIRSSSADKASISEEQARANLQRVEHIVVLMMENRSFDHMLGYLDLLDGQTEVQGLSHAKPITYKGKAHLPEYLLASAFPKSMDPPHGSEEIEKQINRGAMDGFIESFASKNDVPYPERVMGYYTHRELPVYDYLAHNFLLCDRWFSSVPAATWPNRLYALTGTCDPERESLFGDDELFFDFASFVRLLERPEDPDTWRWYSWDPGTLRIADSEYRLRPDERFHHDHFRRVIQHSIEPGIFEGKEDAEIRLGTGLLEDAANGDLPSVAWIDPNFVDLSILEANSNDDHPPSDVRAGQELAMMVFCALAESPCWKSTMLVVTYDEHGGFYDHEPPEKPPEGDPQFATYGVRVPAFVVSPFVEPCTVSHWPFDHTSITRTILERFGVEGAVKKMAETAPRVGEATHLGRLLTRDPGTDVGPPDFAHVIAMLANWRHVRAERRSAASPELAVRSREDRDWLPKPITGFPAEFLAAARKLRELGLPAGHP